MTNAENDVSRRDFVRTAVSALTLLPLSRIAFGTNRDPAIASPRVAFGPLRGIDAGDLNVSYVELGPLTAQV